VVIDNMKTESLLNNSWWCVIRWNLSSGPTKPEEKNGWRKLAKQLFLLLRLPSQVQHARSCLAMMLSMYHLSIYSYLLVWFAFYILVTILLCYC